MTTGTEVERRAAGRAALVDEEAGALEALRRDDATWDRFVEQAPSGAYTQLSPWAAVKAANGWGSVRVIADGGSGPIGAQVLVRKLGPTPFGIGYAPRGPVAARMDRASLEAFTRELRRTARGLRLSHVKIDPELDDPAVRDALAGLGWRPSDPIQPDRTRVIDLERSEDELWSGLRSKWRQYVQKARRQGVAVVESDASRLEDFYAIFVETAERAGFLYRTLDSYRAVYEAFRARGSARLLFARLPSGEPVATLILLECGGRVIEPYGGMTGAGADSRANYLLKWEAIRRARESGFAIYDLWGLAHPGIEQFKTGFGGREVRYVGAWDLVTIPLLRDALVHGHRLRVRLARRRLARAGALGPDTRASPTADAG